MRAALRCCEPKKTLTWESLTWESFRSADNTHLKVIESLIGMAFFSLDIVPKGTCVTVLLVTAYNRPAMPMTRCEVNPTLKGSSYWSG